MICPKCKQKLSLFQNMYKCPNNHSFDISKEGYINLLLSKTNSGDNKDLINARNSFLNKNYYLPLVNKIKTIILSYNPKVLLDAGCGTGYYTNHFKKIVKTIYGCDISKEAIKKAAKLNKEITYIVGSNNFIPLEDNSCDFLVNIFAPYFEDEFQRILTKQGHLLIIHPEKHHLWELKELIYDKPYLNNEASFNFKNFTIINDETLTYNININRKDLKELFMMTPYYYKTKQDDIMKLDTISTLTLTISFKITLFKLN